uniref:Uncharacterized protein n=1 Tax=viral metagenome TaxID=1070528 RepID=A0A6M3XSJ5_9ZZZZ
MSVYTKEQIDEYMEQIKAMTHKEMASLWRFAPASHPFFDRTLPFYVVFKKRFDEFGGFTPEISKSIGWD